MVKIRRIHEAKRLDCNVGPWPSIKVTWLRVIKSLLFKWAKWKLDLRQLQVNYAYRWHNRVKLWPFWRSQHGCLVTTQMEEWSWMEKCSFFLSLLWPITLTTMQKYKYHRESGRLIARHYSTYQSNREHWS